MWYKVESVTKWQIHRMLDTANKLGLEQVPDTWMEPRYTDQTGRVYTALELVDMAVSDMVPRKPMGEAEYADETVVPPQRRDGTGMVR